MSEMQYTTQQLEAEFGSIEEDYSELFGGHDSTADLFFDDGSLPDDKDTAAQRYRVARAGARAVPDFRCCRHSRRSGPGTWSLCDHQMWGKGRNRMSVD